MNRAQALTELQTLYQGAPDTAAGYFDAAIGVARVVDVFGRAPVEEGYVETIDLYWAAAEVADRLALADAMQPTAAVVEQFASEGTNFTIKGGEPVDWAAVAARFRAMSPLSGGMAGAGIGSLQAPHAGADFMPRSAWL